MGTLSRSARVQRDAVSPTLLHRAPDPKTFSRNFALLAQMFFQFGPFLHDPYGPNGTADNSVTRCITVFFCTENGFGFLFAVGTEMASKYRYPDGAEYFGEWSDDGQRHGQGQMTFADGARYIGQFENGLSVGSGIMIFADGSRYSGFGRIKVNSGWF